MKEMYAVVHVYAEDGGYGDAIYTERIVGIAETEEQATEYAEKWSNKHVYDVPYDELYCGILNIEKVMKIDDVNRPPFKYDENAAWAFDKECCEYNEEEE